MMESLTAIRRAGADMIITYFAREAARLLTVRHGSGLRSRNREGQLQPRRTS